MVERYRSVAKYIRISPRKARLAAALIRGLSVQKAEVQLRYCGLKGGRLLMKTLSSAVANAETQGDVRREHLVIEEVRVDEGPRLKRSKPRSRGSRHSFLRRMSHFTVVVAVS